MNGIVTQGTQTELWGSWQYRDLLRNMDRAVLYFRYLTNDPHWSLFSVYPPAVQNTPTKSLFMVTREDTNNKAWELNVNEPRWQACQARTCSVTPPISSVTVSCAVGSSFHTPSVSALLIIAEIFLLLILGCFFFCNSHDCGWFFFFLVAVGLKVDGGLNLFTPRPTRARG